MRRCDIISVLRRTTLDIGMSGEGEREVQNYELLLLLCRTAFDMGMCGEKEWVM